MSGRKRNGHGCGLDARRRYFIAKIRVFLEQLRSHEFVGREEYEEQIEKALQDLERMPAGEPAERIINEICLKVTTACYALRAYDRTRKSKESEHGDK